MVWKCKVKKEKEWQTCFAFFPTPIGTQPVEEGQEIAWLCFLERKFWTSFEGRNYYEYRLKGHKNEILKDNKI